MPLPRWLKVCWHSSQFCGRCVLGLLRWSLWLILILTAGVQVYILTSNELEVPNFVVRELESNLAEAGLHAEFGEITCDPTGQILLRDVQLSLVTTDTTVMRAKAILLTVDSLALWLRQVDPREIRFTGVDLLIPAVLSPSGRAEPVLRNIDATLRIGAEKRLLEVNHFTAFLSDIPTEIHGELIMPSDTGNTNQPLDQLLASATRNYVNFCRRVSRVLPHLPEMKAPRISLELQPHAERIAEVNFAVQVAEINASAQIEQVSHARAENLTLSARFTPSDKAQLRQINLQAGRLEWGDQLSVKNLSALLEAMTQPATGRFEPRILDLWAEQITGHGVTLEHLETHTGVATLPVIQSRATASLTGGIWDVSADLDITTGAGRVKLAGEVGAPTLDLAAELLKFDVPSILSWEQDPYLEADLNLATGGRPLQAVAHISTGPVVARWVPLDATAARVTWADQHLRADRIRLRRGASLAFGSYDMDTDDLDFRFLLHGQLVPSDIDGWFRDWWPALFQMFEFPSGPPKASVEVSGRWQAPLDTRIFISADGHDAVVKGIPLDRMRTRLFVRPGWADVLHFLAERPPGPIEGSFLRQWKLPDSRRWTRVDVHAGGRSDLAPASNLLPGTGDAIIEPFVFEGPLDLRLDGQVTRNDLGDPIEKDFKLTGSSAVDWTFKNFPLQGVAFTAQVQDDVTLIESLSAGMAEGTLTGRVELQGDGDDKQLAFDLNLEKASLGETIDDVATWTAARRGEFRDEISAFEQEMEDGKITVSLTAEGPADNPFGLHGNGSAVINHPNLAKLNLLGVLSTILQRTILNFSTLQLSQMNTDFELAGSRIIFPEVKVTGNRGAVDGSGNYRLDTLNLDFNAKVRPFEGGEGLLDAVFTPFSSALEMKLGGQLGNPEWTFVYGPTNLLRNLTGENQRADAPPPADTPASLSPEETSDSPISAPKPGIDTGSTSPDPLN